jgi:endonuclease G
LPGGSQEAQALNALPTTSNEQVTGNTTDIIPISFLREGLERTPAIGQLRLKEDARPLTGKGDEREIKRRLDPLATCFMISESLVMTAYHVYKKDPDELLPKMEIKFETDEAEHVRPIVREELVLKELDVAILRTSPPEESNSPCLRLNGAVDGNGNVRIVAEEGLQMLHFPANFPGLRLTVHNSFYRERNFQQPALEGVNINHLLIYTTDTDNGSSGAPLMNSSWQLIAVHLGPVTVKDEKLNRGVRADSIVRAIENAAKPDLLAEILGNATTKSTPD